MEHTVVCSVSLRAKSNKGVIMTKVNELKEQLRLAELDQANAQREARKTLEPIYLYHTELTDNGGIRVIGELQNGPTYSAHMAEYGSVYDMPDGTRRGITYYLTIDGYVIGDGGGWIQDPIALLHKRLTKVSLSEWNMIKDSVYPKRLRKEIV